jgi:regulator of replication initiation timing
MGLQAKIQTIIGKLILENATLATQLEELQAQLAKKQAELDERNKTVQPERFNLAEADR